MNKIVLKGEPKSTNHVYKYVCRARFPQGYMSKEGKDIKTDYSWQAKTQWRDKPLNVPLEIWIRIFFQTKRKADWDNFHKLSMDALTGIVWTDDSLIELAHVLKDYDKENPRIEIEVKVLSELKG